MCFADMPSRKKNYCLRNILIQPGARCYLNGGVDDHDHSDVDGFWGSCDLKRYTHIYLLFPSVSFRSTASWFDTGARETTIKNWNISSPLCSHAYDGSPTICAGRRNMHMRYQITNAGSRALADWPTDHPTKKAPNCCVGWDMKRWWNSIFQTTPAMIDFHAVLVFVVRRFWSHRDCPRDLVQGRARWNVFGQRTEMMRK